MVRGTVEIERRKSMRTPIPTPVISVVADIASGRETHASLDSLFMYAAAPGDPPEGSKHVKALEWLRRVNKDDAVDSLTVLGKLIEGYMETPLHQWDDGGDREKIRKVLAQCKLQYVEGGTVVSAIMPLSAASRTLEAMLSAFDYAAVDLKAVWTVVRKHLGFDASLVADQDLQTILTGLLAIVEGIGALRTHASSAHGAGKSAYRLEPRHARLAIHAAHTVVLFGVETWDKRRKGS
jgi:hypothetical protein